MNIKAHWLPKRKLWRARLTINGKPIDFCSKHSAEKAERKAHEYAQDRAAVPCLVPTTTLGGWIAANVAPLYASKGDATRSQALHYLGKIIDALGSIPVGSLSLGDVLRFQGQYGNPHSARTVRKYLFRICRLLARERLIPYNYCEEIVLPKLQGRSDVLVPSEARRLYRLNKDTVMGCPILLGILGVELAAMKRIKREHLKPGLLIVPGTKNAYRHRELPIPPGVEAILRAYLGNNIYLVRGEDGQPLRHNFARGMAAAIARAGVPETTLHGLRHTFAGIELRGCPRSIRKALMGQSAKSDVGDLYVHPTPANMRFWMTKWEQILRLDRPECLPGSGVPARVRHFPVQGVPRAV